jgi:hypothetical protein
MTEVHFGPGGISAKGRPPNPKSECLHRSAIDKWLKRQVRANQEGRYSGVCAPIWQFLYVEFLVESCTNEKNSTW